MENSHSFDFEDFKQQAMKELYAGKPLMGESGIFTPLLRSASKSVGQNIFDILK